MAGIPKVAIACQGGGSHAAFAAGLLRHLLSAPHRGRFELVALSGTSGGAVCAALAWAGMVAGGPAEAERRLGAFWRDLEVHDWVDAVENFWAVWLARLPVTVEISPYLYAPIAEPRLRAALRRHVDLDSLPAGADRDRPKLFVAATDIVNGVGVTFEGAHLGYDDLIASAAIPPIFRAVAAHGTLFWDGVFSRNPPIRELTDGPDRPDEIWIIQINPQHRNDEPRAMTDIIDRRNELSGNLALGQELSFIAKINELVAAYPIVRDRYAPIVIRVVELDMRLDYPSKLDRSGPLIDTLLRHGAARAEWFFDDRSLWPRPGTPPKGARRATPD